MRQEGDKGKGKGRKHPGCVSSINNKGSHYWQSKIINAKEGGGRHK